MLVLVEEAAAELVMRVGEGALGVLDGVVFAIDGRSGARVRRAASFCHGSRHGAGDHELFQARRRVICSRSRGRADGLLGELGRRSVGEVDTVDSEREGANIGPSVDGSIGQ